MQLIDPKTVDVTRIHDILLEEIFADDDFNCRGKIIPMEVVELVKDIQLNGLIQPVTVSPCSKEQFARCGKPYRLIAGFRRFMAHIVGKIPAIKCVIRLDMMEEKTARFFNLSENLHRKDLNIMQEANALKHLRDIGVSEIEASTKIGMSRGWVQVRYMLLSLPPEIQAEVNAGFIGQADIRELFSIFRCAGKDAAFAATRKLKDAKLLGKRRNTVDIKVKRYHAKRKRERPEVLQMMEHMQETIGNGLHTVVMAWMAGEVSDIELFQDIKKYATENGIEYKIPPEAVVITN